MFSMREVGGVWEVLLDGEPVSMSASSPEELYELAASVVEYLEFASRGDPAGVRSGRWAAVRNAFVEAHPACAACGSARMLNVHHVEPFSEAPERELDEGNLICLCFTCHFVFGHLKSWSSHNPDVVADSAWYRSRVEGRPG